MDASGLEFSDEIDADGELEVVCANCHAVRTFTRRNLENVLKD